jgi:EmrB/QacA subfamily drug resistance transporter
MVRRIHPPISHNSSFLYRRGDMAEEVIAVSKRRAWLVLFTITAILFLTFLDTTIMSVAAYDLQQTLHTSVSDLQWIINAYALLFAALMLALGTLGDRIGRKKVMLAGVLVFAGGSLFGALAHSIPQLIAARAIMGVGAAACEPGTLSVIRQIYPDRKTLARAIGWWAAMAGLALAMGPVIGGILVGIGGWHAIFWFNLVASVLVLAAAIPLVSETSDPESGKTDFVGYVLGPVMLGLIVFAIILGETMGYTSWKVLTLFGSGVIALVLFILAEQRAKAPMLEMRYFRRAPFSGSLTVAFTAYFGVFSIFFLTAIYLQVVAHYSALRLAVLFIPMAVCMIVASSLAGRWVAGQGAQAPVTMGCITAGLGVIFTEMALSPDPNFAFLVLSLVVAGIGFGVAVVPITTVALSALPTKHSGMAASATTTTREVGTVLGVAVLGSLFNNRLLTFLTNRLTELKFPLEMRQTITDAVLTGKIPPGFDAFKEVIANPTMAVAATYPEAQRPIAEGIANASQAAFAAVGNGVSWSLWVAGGLIVASGVVAYFTFPRNN